MSLLAVDIGTSRAKGVAFNGSGDILAQCEQGYSPRFPRPSFAELDGDVFWEAFRAICRSISADIPEDPVEAICISSHGETFLPVDSSGRPLGPAILNFDGRAVEESEWCVKTFGARHLFQATGLVAHPMYPLPKLLWLRKHSPELFAAARFVPVTTYLLLRMMLPPLVDFSLASRFLAFDVLRLRWSTEILCEAGIKEERLPIPVPAGSVAGKLEPGAARDLGLARGTMVVVGGHDQACAALGVGAIEDGRAADSAGTYECLSTATRSPQLGDAALAANLNSYCHVVPDLYLNLAYFPSGIMVKWFCDLLRDDGSGDPASKESEESARYAWLEAHAPDGPTGLCITPHLIGTCHPDFNPHARGMIWGLGPASNRAQIYKGILEGIAFEFAATAECLEKITGPFSEICATGGGTRSALGLRLRAALSGKRIRLLRHTEAVCLGGAILASVARGVHSCIPEAARAMVREAGVVEPDTAAAAQYRQQRCRYGALYAAVRNVSRPDSES